MAKTIDEAVNALKIARAELVAAKTVERRLQEEYSKAGARVTSARFAVESAQKDLDVAIDAKVSADVEAAAAQLPIRGVG